MEKISVKESLRAGWLTFKSRPWIFIQAGLILLVIQLLSSFTQSSLEELREGSSGDPVIIFGGLAVSILAIGISFLVSMGEVNFFLRAQKETSSASLKDLWHPHPFWKFVLASALTGLTIILGVILFIVPGIIAGILLTFFPFLVIEKNLGPIAAFKQSIALTKGNRWPLFWFSLAALGINILGFLALFVGLFVTIPVTYLAIVHIYRKLSASITTESVDPGQTAAA